MRCPYCKSDDVIDWEDGYLCRECGQEWEKGKETSEEC